MTKNKNDKNETPAKDKEPVRKEKNGNGKKPPEPGKRIPTK